MDPQLHQRSRQDLARIRPMTDDPTSAGALDVDRKANIDIP
jgi:hypothetical protein